MSESRHTETEPQLNITDHIDQLNAVAYGVSHDYNNLLAAILTNTEALLKKTTENSDEHPYLERIKSTTQTAIALTRQIQSSTEDGIAEHETISPANIALQALAACGDTIPSNCHIDTDQLDAACTAFVTQTLLRLSIEAMLENAIESLLGNEGTVKLRVYRSDSFASDRQTLVLGSIPKAPCIVLEIEDSGDGISPSVLRHIFNPFFTTRLRSRGLGLMPVTGLIASNQSVEVQVKSQKGQGTLFRILFGNK